MGDACDFSWNRPTVDELKAADLGALVYDKAFGTQGSPEKYRAELAAAGVVTAGIHEESGTEAFDGYARGVAAARKADREFSAGVFVYYCAADRPSIVDPDGTDHGPAITEYFRGVTDTTREAEVGAYGPIAALRAAQAGSPKVTHLWGVETWHPQARNNGDPFNVDLWRGEGVHLMQVVGPSPIGGTDLDLVLKPDWAGTEVDMTPEESATLKDIQGILNGGGVYPSLEARIEAAVAKELAKQLAGVKPAGSNPLTINLTGTAA